MKSTTTSLRTEIRQPKTRGLCCMHNYATNSNVLMHERDLFLAGLLNSCVLCAYNVGSIRESRIGTRQFRLAHIVAWGAN